MNKLWGLLILQLVVFNGFSQLQQTERYEIALGNQTSWYEVIPCERQGLIVWNTLENLVREDSLLFQLTVLDTTFQEKWKRTYFLKSNLNFIAQKYHNGKAYLLFGDYTDKSRNLRLLEIDIARQTMTRHRIKNIIPFTFFDMEITGGAIVISGYFNYRPLVLLFDFQERIPRVLPGFFNDKSQLVQLKINENNNIDVILGGRNSERTNTLFINTFDHNGRLLKRIELQASKRKAPLFGRSKSLDGPAQIVAGVYGRKNSEYSRGIFIANINEYGEQKIKYYNYAEFKNFFSYMRAKREERIKRRIERKKIKNKRIRFNYRLLVHDIIEYDDQYILLGEAFFPKYNTIQGSPGVFNSSWSVNHGMYGYDRVFEGFQYTHAVVIGFDKNGQVLWDNSFEIKDVISKRLRQFVHASVVNDKINMLYVFDNAIRSKVVRGNEVIEGKEEIDIKLPYENDKVGQNDTEMQGLARWYDNVFVTYGEQKIKNLKRKGIELSRNVFFINKVLSK